MATSTQHSPQQSPQRSDTSKTNSHSSHHKTHKKVCFGPAKPPRYAYTMNKNKNVNRYLQRVSPERKDALTNVQPKGFLTAF